MNKALLTILIPTYNRAECLALLLSTLVIELAGLSDKVMVIVSDNASPDHTSAVTENFLAQYPSAKVVRHSENVGPDENFCRCIDMVQTEYFWMIGDDDLPKTGVVIKIIALLEHQKTDLLYVSGEWLPCISSSSDGSSIGALTVQNLSPDDFARKVNVWMTFISGSIVNLNRLRELNPELKIRRFMKTNLVQLGWVLPILMTGKDFKFISDKCLLVTAENTGGFKLLTTFGTNFHGIIELMCDQNPAIKSILKNRLIWSFMPGVIWFSRFGKSGDYSSEDPLQALLPIKSSLAYPLILRPLVQSNKYVATVVWFGFRAIKKTFVLLGLSRFF